MNSLIAEILVFLMICFVEVALIAYIAYGLWKLAVGECQEGFIDEVYYKRRARGGVHTFGIRVKSYINYQETRLSCLETFSSMWVYKRKWERLKRTYIGKKVHIYVNPKKPYSQTITRELCWRYFLPVILYVPILLVLITVFLIDILKEFAILFH